MHSVDTVHVFKCDSFLKYLHAITAVNNLSILTPTPLPTFKPTHTTKPITNHIPLQCQRKCFAIQHEHE